MLISLFVLFCPMTEISGVVVLDFKIADNIWSDSVVLIALAFSMNINAV